MKQRSGFVSNSSSSSFIVDGHIDQKFVDLINTHKVDDLTALEFLEKVVCKCPLRNIGSHYMSCNAWKVRFYENPLRFC